MTTHQPKLEKLISELCPGGVEFRELKDVCLSINAGGDLPKNYVKGQIQPSVELPYPIYSNGTGKTALYGYTDSYKVDQEAVTVSARGTIGYHCVRPSRFTPIVRLITLIPNKDLITTKFLNYTLDITEIGSSGGSIPQLTVPNVKTIKIPLPPLPVQEEIVRILDTFTKLEAELGAELEARKRQYEYYRGQLLSDELMTTNTKKVEWKNLGDIAEFKYGFTDKAKNVGDTRFIRITDINENGKLRNDDHKFLDLTKENQNYLLSKGDILMARTGATYGKTMLFDEECQAIYASFLIRIRFKDENILPSYYWHFAQSYFYWDQANKLVGGGAQPQFNANVLKSIKIPVPPLSEQQRIVSTLDKFDALVNDLSIGLPAELKARRQQYEYYRNKLLMFKEYTKS